MKRRLLAGAAGAASIVALLVPASSAPRRQRPEKAAPAKALRELDAPLEETPAFRGLQAYVAAALRAWEPASHLQDDVALAVARAALDPGEPPLFDGDAARVKTAALLASVEHYEGHGWDYVDRGVCNDPARRDDLALRNGGCDGGEAYSLWQIHPERGIVLFDSGGYGYLTEDGARCLAVRSGSTVGGGPGSPLQPLADGLGTAPHCGPRSDRIATGERLLADRALAARTALHMLRASLKRDGSLCEYTGERKPCDKAKKRLDFALDYVRDHPFQ